MAIRFLDEEELEQAPAGQAGQIRFLDEQEVGQLAPGQATLQPPQQAAPREQQITQAPSRLGQVAIGAKNIAEQFSLGAAQTQTELGQLFGQEVAPIAGEKPPVGLLQRAGRFVGAVTAPIPGVPQVPALGFLASSAAKTVGTLAKTTKAFNLFKNFIGKVSGPTSEVLKARLADFFKFASGVPEGSTLRLLEKGPGIFKKEFLDKLKISKTNRVKAEKSFKTAFKTVGEEFDKEVIPLIEGSTEKVAIKPKIDAFVESLERAEIIKVKTSKKGKVTFSPGIGDTGGKLSRPLQAIFDATQEVGENPTLLRVHKGRKRLDSIRKGAKKNFDEGNIDAATIVSQLRQSLVEEFPENYKAVNAKFAKIFNLRDELRIGGALHPTRVEGTLLGLGGKGKSVINEALEELDNFLPQKNKFLDSLLDELAVKDFSDFEPSKLSAGAGIFLGAGAGAAVGGVPGSVAGGIAGGILTSPRVGSLAIRGSQRTAQGLRFAAPTVGPRLGISGLADRQQNQLGLR